MTAVRESPRTQSVLTRAGAWLCLGGAGVGALGLLGWITGTTGLTTIVPGLPPMMPNTALSLLLLGGAGALRQRANIRTARSTLSLLAALAVLVIGAGTLIEHGLGIDMRIDHFLALAPSTSPARPSLPTGLSLTFLATALLFRDVGATARIRPSNLLVVCGAVTAFTSLTGIILGAPALYRSTETPIIGMSLPTALSLLLTSMGVLLRSQAGILRVATSPGPGGILLRRLALPAIALPVVLGLVVTWLVAGQRIEATSVPVAILAAAMAALSLFLLGVTAPRLNRAHEDLQASRAHTSSLVELAPDGIFLADLDGRYTDVNEAGCRMLGYTREEIVGKTIIDLIPSDDIERLWQTREVLLQGPIHVAEWSLRRKDGRYVPVEVSAKILPDGRWQGFVRDITEQRRIEHEQRFLAEVGKVLATTLDYEETASRVAEVAARGLSDFCIVDVVDDDGEMRRLRAVSRDPSRTLICDALQQVPSSAKRPRAIQSAVESRQPVVVQHPSFQDVAAPAQRADQIEALRAVDLHSLMILPLIAHGRLLGAISFLFATPGPPDGGETLRMAQAIAQRAALALDDARLYRAAQRAIKARNEVLGIVAHDLRNPLATILMEARLLRRQGPEPERRSQDSSDAIQRAATRMDRLIQDLLDATRIEARGLAIEPRRVNVAEVTSDAVRVQEPLASSMSLDLRLDVGRELPDVWADRDRLLQVFENLIGNAIKFTPPGGSITVGARRQGTDVLFRVSDTGPGIDIEDQPHVFDRFWQGRTETRGGAGLGLPIVKGLVEAHGGRVWVEGALGQGSAFQFTIPTAQRIEWAQASSVLEPNRRQE